MENKNATLRCEFYCLFDNNTTILHTRFSVIVAAKYWHTTTGRGVTPGRGSASGVFTCCPRQTLVFDGRPLINNELNEKCEKRGVQKKKKKRGRRQYSASNHLKMYVFPHHHHYTCRRGLSIFPFPPCTTCALYVRRFTRSAATRTNRFLDRHARTRTAGMINNLLWIFLIDQMNYPNGVKKKIIEQRKIRMLFSFCSLSGVMI